MTSELRLPGWTMGGKVLSLHMVTGHPAFLPEFVKVLFFGAIHNYIIGDSMSFEDN